jgi:hypothetical protein
MAHKAKPCLTRRALLYLEVTMKAIKETIKVRAYLTLRAVGVSAVTAYKLTLK